MQLAKLNFLRVADINDTRTGGMGRFMNYISDELRGDGHQVEHLFADGLKSHVPVKLRRFVVPWIIVSEIGRRLENGRKYDAVEIHEPSAAAYCLARRVCRHLPPVIVVSYGLESRCHASMLRYYSNKNFEVSFKQRFSPYSVIAQAEMAVSMADQVTVETNDDREYLIFKRGVSPDRITVVNGGITPAFLNAPVLSQDAQGILFLATWIDRKGIKDVVPALAAVAEQIPGLPITIAGFGVPESVVLNDFPGHVQNRLRLVPKVDGEENLLRLYRSHSIFLAPSVFEGQLLTMLEAAAAGLAIVTTNCCGMKDFIRDEDNGLLVRPGDVEGLTNALMKLINQPSFAMKLGNTARQDSLAFTWRRSADQFLDAVSKCHLTSRNVSPYQKKRQFFR